jgi:hypothetical protein
MGKKNEIRLFEQRQVRAVWDEENEKWWFSVLDIIGILTEQPDYGKVRNYWKWLKNKLKEESGGQVVSIANHLGDGGELVSIANRLGDGGEVVSITNQLKMTAPDGKMRLTDVADTEQILRIIQSIPSKKAEPFKQWLAMIGRERIDETIDPELSIERAIANYRRLGYSEDWINQRIKTIEVRKALTDEWDKSGVRSGGQYAALTDLMSKTWSGMTTGEYKKYKGLKKENLRDNMTNTELVLNMLAEVAATDISIIRQPSGFNESADVAKEGAETAKVARERLEKSTGKPAVSKMDAKNTGRRLLK